MARQRVARPWWQSWWFISVVVVLFCLVFGGLTFHSLRQPVVGRSPGSPAATSPSPTG